MSISSELTRITNARDTIRAKMVAAEQATANDDLSTLATNLNMSGGGTKCYIDNVEQENDTRFATSSISIIDTFPQNYTFDCGRSAAVVANDKIYMCCHGTQSNGHCIYRDTIKNLSGSVVGPTNWIRLGPSNGKLPYSVGRGAIVWYNNRLNVLGGNSTKLYQYDMNNNEWTSVSTLPFNPYDSKSGGDNLSLVVVYNNEIHIFGRNTATSSKAMHSKWDGTSWTTVATESSSSFYEGATVIVYNNEIHCLRYTSHDKWNGSSWSSASTLPYKFINGCCAVYDGKLHILGSTSTNPDANAPYKHYAWDGSSWTEVSTLPYPFKYGAAVVYLGELHIMGGENTDSNGANRKDYVFRNSTWVPFEKRYYDLLN